MFFAVVEHGLPGNLPGFADESRDGQRHARAGGNESVQVDRGATLLPEKSVHRPSRAVERLADDLALRIDAERDTAPIAGHASEIGHYALPPQIRVEGLIVLGRRA